MQTAILFAESSFVRFVTHDWLFATILFIMTFAGATLVVWRLWLNYNAKTDLNLFLPKFQEVLNKEGIEGAMKFCKAQPKNEMIPSKLYVAALEKQREGLAAMRKAMANTVELEILPDLNFLLPSILAIAKTATMVGLLFTIISMIGTFTALGEASEKGSAGGQASASAEIGLALFATMFGLLTAIPLVFTHTLCKAWVHKFELKMKNAGQKLLLLIQAAKTTPPMQGPAITPAGAGSACSLRPAHGRPGRAVRRRSMFNRDAERSVCRFSAPMARRG
jgi:biopolymer transport protein ExbB